MISFLSKTYHRYIAILLAFLMFFTSIGYVLDIHYCRGHIKSISFLGEAPSCHQVLQSSQQISCPFHQQMMMENANCSIDEKDCCENKTFHIEVDKDLQIQTIDLPTLHQHFEIAFTASLALFQKNDFSQTLVIFEHYKPPLLFWNLPVLIQSFLL